MSKGASKLSRRTALKLGAAAGVASVVARPRFARAATKIRIVPNYYVGPDHAGFHQAQIKGLYEKAGLDVEIMPGGPQINGMQLMLAGDADVIMGASMTTISAIEKGAPAVAFMTNYQCDPQVMVARKDVTELSQLKDHKLLITTLGRSSYYLWMKQKFGFTDDQLAPYTGSYAPFLQDNKTAIGGVVIELPYRLGLQVPVNYFLLADYGYEPYGFPMVSTQAFLSKERDAIHRFVQASLEGWKSVMTDRKAVSDFIMKERPDMSADLISREFDTIRDVKLLDRDEGSTIGMGTMNDDRWQKLAEFMISAGITKPGVDWKSAYTLEFVKDVHVKL